MRHKEHIKCRNTILIQLVSMARKRSKDRMQEGKKHIGGDSCLNNFYNHHLPDILPPITTKENYALVKIDLESIVSFLVQNKSNLAC